MTLIRALLSRNQWETGKRGREKRKWYGLVRGDATWREAVAAVAGRRRDTPGIPGAEFNG